MIPSHDNMFSKVSKEIPRFCKSNILIKYRSVIKHQNSVRRKSFTTKIETFCQWPFKDLLE